MFIRSHNHLLFTKLRLLKNLKKMLLPFVIYISGAKFEDHCFNISGELLLIQYFIVSVERSMTSSLPTVAYYKNVNISNTKKDIPNRKTLFFFTLKSLSKKEL